MSGGRLPKRIVFGNLEGAVRRGRGGKEKEWTDCVQSDILLLCCLECTGCFTAVIYTVFV